MPKFLILAFLGVLSGCTHFGPDYQPSLTSQPKDFAKYEADRKFCIAEASRLSKAAVETHKDDKLVPALGLIGLAIGKASASPDDAYWKSNSRLTDECMATKGYNLS